MANMLSCYIIVSEFELKLNISINKETILFSLLSFLTHIFSILKRFSPLKSLWISYFYIPIFSHAHALSVFFVFVFFIPNYLLQKSTLFFLKKTEISWFFSFKHLIFLRFSFHLPKSNIIYPTLFSLSWITA